jgi:protein phosphatase
VIDLDDEDDTTPTEVVEALVGLSATSRRLTVVDWGVATTPGTTRRINEDAWSRRPGAYVIADGMGGRGGGSLAARTAIDQFLGLAPPADRGAPAIRDAVVTVNARVVRAATTWGFERVGSTLLAALFGGSVVTVVHVGDSRAYRCSGGHFDLLTRDHTVREELLAAGLDVAEYRDRGVALYGLTSFIGLEHEVPRIDVLAVPMRAGDRLLLCTDGVHRQLDDGRLHRTVATGSCSESAELLVELADGAGGRDNATAMVVQVGSD